MTEHPNHIHYYSHLILILTPESNRGIRSHGKTNGVFILCAGSLVDSLGTGREYLKTQTTPSSGRQSRPNFCINILCDAVGKSGIYALVKCTSAIRQLAYAAVPDSLDKYLQIGGIDCTKWPWAQCPQAYRAQFSRGDFGDKWVVLMKSISQPGSNDVKRIRYKQAYEAARKDVERAFGVLKKKWAIVRTPARSRSLKRITHLMYTCIILHNMIRKEKRKAISPDFYPEEQHREDDPVRSAQDRLRVIREMRDEETHLNLPI
nr:putative nuclease HARBI1 isoform X2 [Tanacetum cinerariifolium]